MPFSLPSRLDLLAAAPNLPTQLSLAALNAVVWYVVITLATWLLMRTFRSKPWRKRWLAMHKQTAEKAYMIVLDSDEAIYEMACAFLGVLSQHLVGGLLCLPSALGYSTELAFTLARHGTLCEVGWEVQDVVVRVWQCTASGAAGRAKNPAGLVLILVLHHTMAMSLAIPMNLWYPRNHYVHEAVCLLQVRVH